MFPYYWNGFVYTEPFVPTFNGLLGRDVGLDGLPDEVLEALELHKNEIHNEKERDDFIRNLDLRK